MEEEELLSLCQTQAKNPFRLVPPPYWTSEIYSFGKYLREYGRYPSFLPLCVYTDHAPAHGAFPNKHELDSDAPTQLYHSPQVVENWRRVSSKPCHVVFSPWVYYRRSRGIERAPDARGTLAFLAHGTTVLDVVADMNAYIDDLLGLPEEFQPVTVCIHMHDVRKGLYRPFLKRQVPICTVGNSLDDRFVARFYDLLRRFKYSTSTVCGSYLYYSVEMGIPFFFHGATPTIVNRGDPNLPMGEVPRSVAAHVQIMADKFTAPERPDPGQEAIDYAAAVRDLFTNRAVGEITPEEKALIAARLGLNDGISRIHMSWVLYSSLVRWAVSKPGRSFIRQAGADRLGRLANRLSSRWSLRGTPP